MINKTVTVDNEKENAILTGTIWKQLLLFFFPLLGGTFFQMLYNTVDAIVVGRFVGKEALSAVGGTTGTLINLFVGFFVGLSSGATVIVAQYYGAGKDDDVKRSVHTGMFIAIASGLFLTVLVSSIASPMLHLMNTPDDVIGGSITYIMIYSFGMVGNLTFNMGSSILRAVGDSKRPFYALICGTLFNIAADLFLVVVLHLGIAGVAIATILSQYLSAGAVVWFLVSSEDNYRLLLREIRPDRVHFEKIIRIGVPAAFQSLMYSVSNVCIQVGVNSFGTDTVAAWTVWGKIDALFWMVINSLGIATTTFIGQNYGAGLLKRVRKCVRQSYVICYTATILMVALFFAAGPVVIRIFTTDAEVLDIAVQIVYFMAPTFLIWVPIEISSDSLRGMGEVLIPTVITCICICLLQVIWVFSVLKVYPVIQAVIASYPISWGIASVFFLIYYSYYVKKHRIF